MAINKRYLLASLYSREEYQKSSPLLVFRKVYVNSETPHSFNSLFIFFRCLIPCFVIYQHNHSTAETYYVVCDSSAFL